MSYRVAPSLFELPSVVCSVAFAATCVFISPVAAVPVGASEVGEPAREGAIFTADAPAGRSGVEAVHVLGHGSEGSFQLGSTWVNTSNLEDYAEEFTTIPHSLAAGADLLLYGC